MIPLGLVLLVWGSVVFGFARTFHENWRPMIRRLKGAGIDEGLRGARFIATGRGLRAMRLVGLAVAACGLGCIVAGALAW